MKREVSSILHRSKIVFAAFLCVLAFVSCSDDDDDDYGGDDTQYTITGDATITSASGVTYTVNGIPSGYAVDWNISDTENFKVSRNGYNSAIVVPKASGVSATLYAIIRNADETLATVQKTIKSSY